MEHLKRIYLSVLILNLIDGILCDDDESLTGIIVSSTVAGFLLFVVVIAAVIFLYWKEAYKRQKLRQGKIKVPRLWLDQDRLAKKQRKQIVKHQLKDQIKQKQLMKGRPNGSAREIEMNNMHRSRPQIPGSWRREIRHPNGYIVKEVPTLQRVLVTENQYAQPMGVEVREGNPAVWQPSYSSANPYAVSNSSIVIPQSARADADSSSQSSGSTTMAGDRLLKRSNQDDEIIEATIDFTNDGALGKENMIQENVTAF